MCATLCFRQHLYHLSLKAFVKLPDDARVGRAGRSSR